MEEIKIKQFLTLNSSSGTGYGCGSGSDDGDGTGDGAGCGSGSDDGTGYGCGYEISKIKDVTIYDVDNIDTVFYSIHKNVAKGAIFNRDFTFTPCYIVKGNNHFAHGETIEKAMEALQKKIFADLDVEGRIEKFVDEFDLNKKYPAMKFYEWHNKLTGSCEMGRKIFAKDHNIDLDNDEFTVEEFIKITEISYGGRVILQLKERLGL